MLKNIFKSKSIEEDSSNIQNDLEKNNIDQNLLKEYQDRLADTSALHKEVTSFVNSFEDGINNFKDTIDIDIENEIDKTDKDTIKNVQDFHINKNLLPEINNISQYIEEEVMKYENNKIYKGEEIIDQKTYQEIMKNILDLQKRIFEIKKILKNIDYRSTYTRNGTLKNSLYEKRATKKELLELLINQTSKREKTNESKQKVIYYNKSGKRKHNALLKHIEYYNDQILGQFEIITKNGRKIQFASGFKDENEFFDHVRDARVDIYEEATGKDETRNIGHYDIDKLKDILIETQGIKQIAEKFKK